MSASDNEKKSHPSRLIFAIFGFYGIVLACLEGLKPLIEVSKFIAWISSAWLDWTRELWKLLADLIDVSLPVWVADAASGTVYL
ncbi:MAG: hypothetical protein AAGG11_24085, partial [Pseudomonadota bacterium]